MRGSAKTTLFLSLKGGLPSLSWCLTGCKRSVTARGYVGGRASGGKFRDEYFLYKTRDKGEAMLDDVRVVEEGAADYGARGRYDPPRFGFHVPSSCSCCCDREGVTEIDTSAGQAKRG